MKSLTKKYKIQASANDVYKALVKQEIVALWSGEEAVMTDKEGDKFSLWGGSIHGKNREVSKSRIVQEWQEKGWEKPSKVTFNILDKDGATELELIHEDIPEASYNGIDDGWDEYYLGPLKKLLENR